MNPLAASIAASALVSAAGAAAAPVAAYAPGAPLTVALAPPPVPASEIRLTGTPSTAPCRIEPFADDSAEQREALWGRSCGGEHVRLGFERAGPSAVRARLNSVVTERVRPPLVGIPLVSSIRLAWSGVGDAEGGGLRTEQGILAAASSVRLGEEWSVRANVGREITGSRTRTTLASIWRPARGLIFAEWAGSEERTEAHRVGARWWLLPKRLAIDIGARYLPDGIGWVDQGIRLSFFARHL